MTGPVVPAGREELREALAEALRQYRYDVGEVVDTVLPTVLAFAEEQGRPPR